MAAVILDGNKLAREIKEDLRQELLQLKKTTGFVPHLVNVMIGDDHGSCAYARSQKKAANDIGIDYELVNLPKKITQKDFVQYIRELNENKNVNGIMIHKPIPSHIDYREAANEIDTEKDLEGINVKNVGRMLLGQTHLIPCTPAAVVELIKATEINLRGKEVVIVGASEIVGKPLALLLVKELATVTICHIGTSEAGHLTDHIKRAEILIVAVGKPGLIKGEWLKDGATVIDVGINQVGDKIVGDVEYEQALKKVSFITPVPGGVGPLTVVMLMRNGVEAYKMQRKISGDSLKV